MANNISKTNYWFLAFWLLLPLGFALRLWMAQPPNTSDELSYFHLANSFFLNNEGMVESRGRLAMLAWIRMASLAWGDHWLGFYLAVYAGALLSSISVALFARTVLNETGSVLFSLLWATSFIAISTETRLFVDVVGSGFAMLGLFMALRAAGLAIQANPVLQPKYWAVGAGVLLWIAILVRETFFTHVIIALYVAWLAKERRTVLLYLLAGLAGGLFLELLLTGIATGSIFTRYDFLLTYPKLVASAPIFQGHSWDSFLIRYPRMLWYTQSAELILFVMALLGCLRWWGTRPLALSRVGLVGVGVSFGLVAFALVNLSPPVPLLRESPRYYLTAMPFLYWAATVLFLSLYRAFKNIWKSEKAILFLALPLFSIVAINLHTARNQKDLIRNGNDMPFIISEQLQKNSLASPATIYLDDNLRRAITLFIPPSKGWNYRDLRPPYADKGFLLLDFNRMHYNVSTYNYHYGQFDPYFYRMVERYPILWRSLSPRNEFIEMYRVGQQIRRTGGELPWQNWSPSSSGGKHRLQKGESLVSEGNGETFSTVILSGTNNGYILQLRFRMRSMEKLAAVEGMLTTYKGETPSRVWMGKAWSDNQERELALWVWLDKPLNKYAVTLTSLQGGVEIGNPRLFLMQTLAEDKTLFVTSREVLP